MKKARRVIIIALVLAMLMGTAVLAAEVPADKAGIYDVAIENGFTSTVTVTPDGTNNDGFYEDAVKMSVSYSAAESGKQYAIFVTEGEQTAPTESSLVYINQEAGSNGVTFPTVYPKELKSGSTYYIYISGTNMAYTKVASFKYYLPYKLGDVDADGDIDTNDAVAVLKHVAELHILEDGTTPFLAADVDINGVVNTNDAVMILKHVAELINLETYY